MKNRLLLETLKYFVNLHVSGSLQAAEFCRQPRWSILLMEGRSSWPWACCPSVATSNWMGCIDGLLTSTWWGSQLPWEEAAGDCQECEVGSSWILPPDQLQLHLPGSHHGRHSGSLYQTRSSLEGITWTFGSSSTKKEAWETPPEWRGESPLTWEGSRRAWSSAWGWVTS